MGGALNERRAVLPGVHTFSLLFPPLSSVIQERWGHLATRRKKLSQEEISNRSNGAKKVVPLSVQIESYAPRVVGVGNRPADVERRTRMPKEIKKQRSNQTLLYSKYTMWYAFESSPYRLCSMAMLQLIIFASLSPLSRKLLTLLSRLRVKMMLCCAHSRRKYKSKIRNVLTSVLLIGFVLQKLL